MTVIRHELKQSRISLIIWTVAIGFLLAVCIFMFPEMKGEMDEISNVFSSMGSFTQAFGMDKVNFGTLLGFYSVECGNILGLGGAFFASLCAISVLSKEEKERTAEFLFTHPISRVRVVAEKLISVLLQIVILNAVVYAIAVSSIAIIGETVPWQEITLMHTAYLLLQVELAGVCFGVSAFLRRGSLGTGLGIAVIMYFLNIIANLTESAEFLKYITPFGYADGAEIVRNVSLDMNMIAIGIMFAVIGISAGFVEYSRKDIS